MVITNKQYEFGRDILGPLLYEFCRRLSLHLVSYDETTNVLFNYRGGVRLLYLFDKFIKDNNIHLKCNTHKFYISRLHALKACAYKAPAISIEMMMSEYSKTRFDEFIKCFSRPDLVPDLSQYKCTETNRRLIKGVLYSSDPKYREIQEYLKNQGDLLQEYIESFGASKRIVLVDTGWTGNTQKLLMCAYPKYMWQGLYFGKWDYRNTRSGHLSKIKGLMIDSEKNIKRNKLLSLLYYHHIIEQPLEPNIPTVTGLVKNQLGEIGPEKEIDVRCIPPNDSEYIFSGIIEHFVTASRETIDQHYRKYRHARNEIHKNILYPSLQDLKILDVGARSIDMGRDKEISIINRSRFRTGYSIKSKIKRIRSSLWKQGSIVNEFGYLSKPILLYYNKFSNLNKIIK